ncbi:MAG: hypothetical protein GC164_02825 [Phycisphaera sp.]|nr:hypothetical protein [Phycisphaera sp.]
MTLVPASMLSASDLAYLGPTVTDLVRSKRALHGWSRRDLHHLEPAVRRSLGAVGEVNPDDDSLDTAGPYNPIQ